MKKRILILSALLTLSLVGCGSAKETNAPIDNSVEIVTTTEPITESTAVFEDLGTSQSVDRGAASGEVIGNNEKVDIQDNTNQGTSNGGSLITEFEKAPETVCTLEDMEPTTMYAKGAGMLFYDPNILAQDETLTSYLQQTGSYEAGQEFTFTQKTTYENIEYYVYTRQDGLVVIAEATNFQSTPLTAEEVESAPEMQDPTVKDREELSDEDWDAIEAEALKELGYTDEEIEQFINPDTPTPSPDTPVVEDDLGPMIGPGSSDSDASDYDWDNGCGGMTPEQSADLDGMLNG